MLHIRAEYTVACTSAFSKDCAGGGPDSFSSAGGVIGEAEEDSVCVCVCVKKRERLKRRGTLGVEKKKWVCPRGQTKNGLECKKSDAESRAGKTGGNIAYTAGPGYKKNPQNNNGLKKKCWVIPSMAVSSVFYI